MIYYLCVFLSGFLISIGLLLLKKPFFSFAMVTVSLLNTMFDSETDENIRHKLLIKNLGKLLSKFSIFLIVIAVIIGISIIPVLLYMQMKSVYVEDLDMGTFQFYFSIIIGSLIFFILLPEKKNKDYSDWSVLFHKMVLDNYNISKSLFGLEKRLFNKKIKIPKEDFVIVTGLARAGTTALTNLFFESGNFHSLTYANMPFLMAPNIWKKFYNPKKSKKKQRAHGDKVMFGYNTIEALEEYFFKVFLNDKYIKESTLVKHDIDENTYNAYLSYQNLVKFKDNDSTYLAKNNNFILRYKSFRKLNTHFKIILIFRDPVDHALSLMNQHDRFSKLQTKDSFILEYMNWLGHYEFGLNHKYFDFENNDLANKYQPSSVNYWLFLWINYYTEILSLLDKEDKNFILVDYNDLLLRPVVLISALSDELKMELSKNTNEPFIKTNKPKIECELELTNTSILVYKELVKQKIQLSY